MILCGADVDGRTYLPPGTLLDSKYRIERVVGAGGFGVTYRAEDINLGTTVAVKEYFPEQFGTRTSNLQIRPTSEKQSPTFEWGRSSFLQEARILARFRHPSVVRVISVFEANSTAYMVMEFEQGQSFEMWLRDLGRAPHQDELDRMVGPLLDALELMHGESFLHRDIAPDNIIVRSDRSPVLLDFGAARKAVAERSQVLTGMVKQGYSPHEQYATDGRHQGPWSDFYAFGATLYRAVTGRPPDESTLRVVEDQLVPAEQAARGSYRSGFLNAINTSLRIRPSERPQDVTQFRSLLRAPASPLDATDARPTRSLPDNLKSALAVVDLSILTRLPHVTLLWIMGVVFVSIALIIGLYELGWQKSERQISISEKPVEIPKKTTPELEPPQNIAPPPPPASSDAFSSLLAGSGQSARDQLSDGSDCRFCPEMVVVPAGNFIMGSPDYEPGRDAGEEQLSVLIGRPFAVGKFAVTFNEWDACIADGACNRNRPSDNAWGRGKRPVINVNWDDAKFYAGWISRKTGKPYRLLSDAEREYVTRAGTTTPFWWGRSITPAQANYDTTSIFEGGGSKGTFRKRTVPVDNFAPNPWGLYQVHGNVYEWGEDCWNVNNTGNPGNGSARTTGECTRRVVRGAMVC